MKNKSVIVILLVFLLSFAGVYLYFQMNKEHSIHAPVYREMHTVGSALQSFNRADLLYRMGKDDASLQEAERLLREALLFCNSIQSRIDPNDVDIEPIMQNTYNFSYDLKEAILYYLEYIKVEEKRQSPPKAMKKYHLALNNLNDVIRSLGDYKRQYSDFSTKELYLICKNLLMSTLKIDSYENRYQIYEQISTLINREIIGGPANIIGEGINGNLFLVYYMRKPKDLLFDIIFRDLKQSIKLYGIRDLSAGDLEKVKPYIQSLNDIFIRGKRLRFTAGSEDTLSHKPKVIVILENGEVLQEYILSKGISSIDPETKGIPLHWIKIAENAKEIRRGVYQ